MRGLVLLLMLYVGPASASAQESLRDRAWSAWRAGASHDAARRDALIGELRGAQRFRDARRDSEEYAYVQALLDALIQIPGPVPSEAILPFEKSWRAEVLILLNREPAANESVLLELREHSMTDAEWDAVNDLLFRISSKTFFERVLEELRITHEFVIADQDVLQGGGPVGCGHSTRRFPAGFPPIGLYQMWTSMVQTGDVLFLERPVATYYRRVVAPTEWIECEQHGASDEIRQERLGQILGAMGELTAKESRRLFHPRSTIRWRGAAEEMERLMDEQAGAIERLMEDVQRRGVMRVSGIRLTIRPQVVDARRDRSVEVPAIAAREIVVR